LGAFQGVLLFIVEKSWTAGASQACEVQDKIKNIAARFYYGKPLPLLVRLGVVQNCQRSHKNAHPT